ncbi:hypothetical protein TYRP_010414 [Tyrophagus putrescentiae]|nr:hypothetical protein TYRP_010414 [Tyrophagus putrescentiae]
MNRALILAFAIVLILGLSTVDLVSAQWGGGWGRGGWGGGRWGVPDVNTRPTVLMVEGGMAADGIGGVAEDSVAEDGAGGRWEGAGDAEVTGARN